MPCKCNCEESAKRPIQINTTKQGTWIENNGEDLHVYSTSLCEGGDGSTIGFNSKLMMKNKIGATPLAVVMQDNKIWLQETTDSNVMLTYDIDKDKFYDLLMDFLHDVKDTCLTPKPTSTVDLNKR